MVFISRWHLPALNGWCRRFRAALADDGHTAPPHGTFVAGGCRGDGLFYRQLEELFETGPEELRIPTPNGIEEPAAGKTEAAAGRDKGSKLGPHPTGSGTS